MNRRELFGFATIGTSAFVVDTGLLSLLMAAGLPALGGRLISLFTAMTFAWYGNRRLTFRLAHPPSLREYASYLAMASGVAVVNYLLFAVLVLAGLHAVLATALATGVSMFLSFAGMKFGVFRQKH